MTYTIDRRLEGTDFHQAEQRTREALTAHGFGVLTEIDLKSKLKSKLDAEIADYTILGACHPPSALEAVTREPRIGAMLPCNVILRKVGDDVEVSAIDPEVAFDTIDNEELRPMAAKIRKMLQDALAAI